MNSKLNPYYIVGLVDGEGRFYVSLNKRKDSQKPEVRLLFEIELRADDKQILERVKQTLGCGNIYYLDYERYKKWKPHYKYKVSNIVDIWTKVIPFFKKYPLKSSKLKDFERFSEICQLMINTKNKQKSGLEEIISLAMKMNSSGKRKYNTQKLLSILE